MDKTYPYKTGEKLLLWQSSAARLQILTS
jgi:hypothetical protein